MLWPIRNSASFREFVEPGQRIRQASAIVHEGLPRQASDRGEGSDLAGGRLHLEVDGKASREEPGAGVGFQPCFLFHGEPCEHQKVLK